MSDFGPPIDHTKEMLIYIGKQIPQDITIATLREEIAALKAEVERLKGESKWAAEVYEISLEERKKLKSRAESAEAKVEKVRERIEKNSNWLPGCSQVVQDIRAIIGEP